MDREKAGTGFCRDCFNPVSGSDGRCPSCRSPRLLRHPELHQLATAHLDCDAFYAAIEKRDDPTLKDKPVIVGHPGGRGVVTTACYVARRSGPRSAMPMFQALRLLPSHILSIEGEQLGVLVFVLAGAVLMLVPFLDVWAQREHSHPVVTWLGVAAFLFVVVMTVMGLTTL